ncbi:MAG: sulfotransferase domain-containing protein [Microcoleaceae cyanobacterium]
MNSQDIFLASFPRSGNTWMRLLLSDLILQIQGFLTKTGGNIIPDIYKVDIEQWNQDDRTRQLDFRIIKTHEHYEESYRKIIYLFRNPADSLCSFYYYQLDRVQKFIDRGIGLDQYCQHSMDQWCTHVKSYIQAQEEASSDLLFLSYETMKQRPIAALQLVAHFIGLKVSRMMCKQAVQHQKFEKLKKKASLEKDSILGFNEVGGYKNFFRKGEVNSAKEELSIETIKLIESNALKIYQQASALESSIKIQE